MKIIQDWIYNSDVDIETFIMSPVQRNYVWKQKDVEKLLESFQNNEISFLGGIAYIDNRSSKKALIISDGCQRLTTIFLIAKIYQEYIEKIKGKQLQLKNIKYVNQDDTDLLKIIKKTTFTNCPSAKLFKNHLDAAIENHLSKELKLDKKSFEFKDLKAKFNDSNIYKNLICLTQLIYDESSERFEQKFEVTAEHFLKSALYANEIPSGCDEVETFIKLNSTGQAVSLADIVKAYCPDSLGGKTYNNYNELRDEFKRIFNKDKKFEDFLIQISCYNPGSQSRDSSSKAKNVEFYEQHMKTYDDLKPYAEMYLKIIKKYKYVKFLIEKSMWPNPVSTFIFKIYNAKKLNDTEKESILHFVSKWLYKNIPYKESLTGKHSEFQRDLGEDKNSPFKLLSTALENLEEQQNNSPQISLKYVEDILNNYLTKYSDWDDKTKEGLNYSLGNNYIISVFNDLGHSFKINGDPNDDKNKPTVEHIYSQEYEKNNHLVSDVDKSKRIVNMLGNLTLLSHKDNSSLKDAEPITKFNNEIYSNNASFQPTRGLSEGYRQQKYNQWTKKEIEERHKELVKAWISAMDK